MTESDKNLDILPFHQWFESWADIKNLVIAGPCSAESYQQLRSSLMAMKGMEEWQVLRLGIWKPRSRPGGFDGNVEALNWIKELKQEFDFKCAVEVATAQHVAQAIDAQIDMVWVGARTVGLPFAVEELAVALQNYDIPVLIKNPLSPDINLWAGAVERFLAKGITKLAIVHRGFSWPYSNELRNWPMWSAVAQMKMFFPKITVLGDPSHIAGDAALVPKIALDALHFGCDGLMIETHPNPKEALSDAKQQIPLSAMPELLALLKKPELNLDHSIINNWRMHIDEIDQQIVHLLKKRDEVTGHIAQTKKDEKLQVVDYQRFQSMLSLRKSWFQANEEDSKYIDQIFNLLHERSIQRQLNIFNKSDSH